MLLLLPASVADRNSIPHLYLIVYPVAVVICAACFQIHANFHKKKMKMYLNV
jgi:hypothetical protein